VFAPFNLDISYSSSDYRFPVSEIDSPLDLTILLSFCGTLSSFVGFLQVHEEEYLDLTIGSRIAW
jgi:hypothetical protein